MGNGSADLDSFCRELLETGGPQEVSKWIHEGKNTLGELGRDESISLADGIYKAGAPHVYAVEIDEYDQGENTGKLIIELSDDAAARKRAFAWAGKIAREQGFDPECDVGQRYIFSMLDWSAQLPCQPCILHVVCQVHNCRDFSWGGVAGLSTQRRISASSFLNRVSQTEPYCDLNSRTDNSSGRPDNSGSTQSI